MNLCFEVIINYLPVIKTLNGVLDMFTDNSIDFCLVLNQKHFKRENNYCIQ